MTDRRRRNSWGTDGTTGLRSDSDGWYRLTGLYQSWQRRVVLNVPEMNLQEGRRYALLGANGAGKSTLLRLLAERLGQPDGQTAYLPQKPYAFAMSVQNNIGLGIPASLGLDRQQRQEAIRNQLDRLGLADLADARGNRLSGGEAQRMGLARLLVVPRRILLLDEPGGSLDLNNMAQAEDALANYLAENRCLLVMATHQISLARRLCDELIFLDQGELLATGALHSQLDQPEQARLRLFLRYGELDKEVAAHAACQHFI